MSIWVGPHYKRRTARVARQATHVALTIHLAL